MIEHAQLFTTPMVLALLRAERPKTQTRRIVSAQNSLVDGVGLSAKRWDALKLDWGRASVVLSPTVGWYVPATGNPDTEVWHLVTPRVEPGHLLWVRENGWERPERTPHQLREGADTWPPYEYDAQPLMSWEEGDLLRLGWKRRPSIHMPRWACRIELSVTNVRAQRLNEIDGIDAIAEGLVDLGIEGARWHWLADAKTGYFAPWRAYRALWQLIHGGGTWDEAPPVWAYTFTRSTP